MYVNTEKARLDALHQLKILDTSPNECFDRITRLASQFFDLPIAAISLTDVDRQWFKSRIGVEQQSIPREKAPCARVAQTTNPLVIEDFLADPCYADSVLARAGTRFYAGTPLITDSGYGLGALCVLGPEPRRLGGGELHLLGDLAAMVMAQIELRHAFGRIDQTSGLMTRNQFREDLSDLEREHPGQQRVAVVVDLAQDDQLTRIRRVLGGGRIETLIHEAAIALRSVLGPTRTAYRSGMVNLAFLSPPDVDLSVYMMALHAKFRALQSSSSDRFVTTMAMGVRPFRLGEISADDVLRSACNAAYDARRTDQPIALYCASNDTTYERQYRLLRDFGAALEAPDQLRLVYQPRIDLVTGRCVSAEALLRWRHPTLGNVSPAEFIPIVEQTSLARPATQWVLNAALNQIATWNEAGEKIKLSINISTANLTESDLVERLQAALLERQVAPQQLEIELTESAIMDQPDQAMAVLREIAAAGICLAIDDFGTGHSSLAYLQNLPASVLKIDQSFVRNLSGAEGPDFDLVETMIGLAHKLGFKVVAEGIETAEVAAILTGTGCEEGQGYWFSRPIEADEFMLWVAQQDPHDATPCVPAKITPP